MSYNKMKIPDNIKNIMRILKANNYEVFIVGGACRDYMMGKQPVDFDLVTSATPDNIITLFPQAKIAGNSFLVSLIDGIEVATYRQDNAENAIPVETLEEDILRRDFTINGMGYGIVCKKILDYVGGIDDINNRILRFIGNPWQRIEEDPIRILRGVRFASKYNLTIEKETYFAMIECRNKLKDVPKERLQLEIIKAFKTDNTHRFLTMLDEMEMFEILFPSIFKLKGIDGGGYHNETVFTHSLGAVKAVEDKNWQLKLACLYHDAGKHSPIINDKGFNTFCGHNTLGLDNIVDDLKNHLKFPNDIVDYVKYLSLFHMNHVIGKKSMRRTLAQLSDKNIPLKDFIYLRYADKKGNVLYNSEFFVEWCLYRRFMEVINEKPPLSPKMLEIDGTDVMKILNIPPSKQVGDILNILFDMVINEEIENKREILLDKIKEAKYD